MNNKNIMDEARWMGKLRLGGWTSGRGDEYDVTDKATGEKLTSLCSATPEDVAKAAGAARKFQSDWFAMPYEERAAIFRKAAALVDANADELATWIMRETGAIRPKADVELQMASGILNMSSAMLTSPNGLVLPSNTGRMSFARRMPLGVVGVISPFNFPLILSIRAVSPALATGNTVVLKPDMQTAVSGGMLIARLFEEAGLPEGALQVLPGGPEVGRALCQDPNIAMIAFTGSTAVGRQVGELCGKHLKKVSLELGGKNTLIVLDDADLDVAASNVAFGAWLHQGQICMATGRVLAHKKIADSLVEKLVEKANHLPVGDPMSGQVALGPIINERQVQKIQSIVDESVAAGVELKAGGSHDKLFYKPTVLYGAKPGMRAFDEEIFGPVASVTAVADDEEAIGLANQTDYGLSAAIISRSIARALAIGNRLNTGLLHINDQTVNDEPHIPFGGRGASGNGTSIGGPSNWDEFTQWQWVTIKDAPPSYPF